MGFISPGFFRLILALIVVVHHNVDFLLIGHASVYIFFVLSGYWIAKMYKEKYQYLDQSYKTFIISRLLRLMPIYFLILIISVVTAIIFKGLLSYPSLITPGFILPNLFVLGLNNAEYALLLPGWSLDIEIQFYIIAPLLLVMADRISKVMLLIIFTCISILSIFFLGEEFSSIFSYLPLFMVGMYIYIYDIKSNAMFSTTCLYTALGLYAMQYIHPGVREVFLYQPDFKLWLVNYRELINVCMALLILPYLTLNVRLPGSNKFDKVFSSMSYVIYLLHWPAIKIYSSFVTGMSTKEKVPLFILYIAGCVIVSFLISISYDEFFEKKRRGFLNKRKVPKVNT